MFSGLLLLNQRGDLLLSRVYRDEITRGVATAFKTQVIQSKEIRSPIKNIGSHTFMHIKIDNLYLVAVSKHNCNVAIVFEGLYRMSEIFKNYLDKMTDDTVRDYSTLILELFDEFFDWGYPQLLTMETVKPFITQKGVSIRPEKLKQDKLAKITVHATGGTPWRTDGIKYKKNEIYIDIIESVNVLVSTEGKLLRSDVGGKVQMKCELSGMPDCKFGLNDKILMDKEAKSGARAKSTGIELDDCNFHQCVKLGKFDTDRTISFIPPDGEFELMRYRSTENITLPFKVFPNVIEHSRTRLEGKIRIKSLYSRSAFANNVALKFPVPKNTALVEIKTQIGKAKYRPEENAVVWRIKKFPGGEYEASMDLEVQLSAHVSASGKWSRPPISMEFQVPMFSASGLKVRFLKVLEPKQQYQTVKWVRYLTQAGSYLIRI